MKKLFYPRLKGTLAHLNQGASQSLLKSVLSILEEPHPARNLGVYLSSLVTPRDENLRIPLDLLFVKLRAVGIETDPATVLDIQKVLATSELVPKNLDDLHIVIRALVCKNFSQLAGFDLVFFEFLSEVKQVVKNRNRLNSQVIEEVIKCYKSDRKQFKVIRLTVTLVLSVIAMVSIWFIVSRFNQPPEIAILEPVRIWPQDSARSYFVVGDSVALSYEIAGKLKDDQRVKWMVAREEKVISSNKKVIRLDSSETLLVTAAVLSDAGQPISEDSITIQSVCEKIPDVQIEQRKGKALGERFVYGSKVSNASKDSARYRYVWTVNDTVVSNSHTFDTIFVVPSNHTIGLRVEYDQGVHCSTEYLEDFLAESVGGVSLSVSGEEPVEFISQTKFSVVLPIALFLLIILAGLYYLILRIFRKRNLSGDTADADEVSNGYPLTIEFKKQDAVIKVDKSLAEMAANFSKRQRSEEFELDIAQTIKRTCRSAGFPLLSYREKMKKEGFV